MIRNTLGIYIVHPDGSALSAGSPAQLETAGTPHWSPDGSRLGFYVGDVDQVCRGGLIFGTGTTQIVSVRPDDERARDAHVRMAGVKVFPRWLSTTQVAYQTRDGVRFTGGEIHASPVSSRLPTGPPTIGTWCFTARSDPRGDRDRAIPTWSSYGFGIRAAARARRVVICASRRSHGVHADELQRMPIRKRHADGREH